MTKSSRFMGWHFSGILLLLTCFLSGLSSSCGALDKANDVAQTLKGVSEDLSELRHIGEDLDLFATKAVFGAYQESLAKNADRETAFAAAKAELAQIKGGVKWYSVEYSVRHCELSAQFKGKDVMLIDVRLPRSEVGDVVTVNPATALSQNLGVGVHRLEFNINPDSDHKNDWFARIKVREHLFGADSKVISDQNFSRPGVDDNFPAHCDLWFPKVPY